MKVWMTGLHGIKRTAGLAQMMSVDIGRELGFNEIGIYCTGPNFEEPEDQLRARISGTLSAVESNDVVVLQLPSWNTSKFDMELAKGVKRRMNSAHVVIFIHDIGPYMFGHWDELDEWIQIYNQAEVLIVPNHVMKEHLIAHGCTVKKFVYHYVWDNPTDIIELQQPLHEMKKLVQFPSDPNKFQFANSWPSHDIPLHYYSKDQSSNPNLIQHHPLPNEELMLKMHKIGGYGVLWEPPEMKLYWKMNSSMKFGTYLSAGLPILVHQGIAQQEIVSEYHLGKVIETEDEAVDFIDHTTEDEYLELADNVNKMGKLTRNGYFLKQALMEAVYRVFN
ncbi:hypothetical protein [Lactobacillus kalixensis]|nr:hypothetical protein [Lactobacillus kalixensis]